MNVLDEIAQWAAGMSGWQCDAIRRLLTKGILDEKDTEEIYKMLKYEHGLGDPTEPAPAPCPLKKSEIRTPKGEIKILLKSMHSLKNVNALASDQKIKFALNGVTVIYGENATGKSGYSRVLKKACKARDVEDIHPNVFKGGKVSPAEAIFKIKVNDEDTEEHWVDGGEAPKNLSEIAVFDSKCARFYIDVKNEVVFIPYGLDVFKNLAKLCDLFRARLEKERGCINDLPEELIKQPETTTVGSLIKKLTFKTSKAEIEKNSILSEREDKRLNELEQIFLNLKANNPKQKIENLRRQRRRVEKYKDTLNASEKLLSNEKIGILKIKWMATKTAEEAAKIASQNAFKEELLPGVGSEPWKELFHVAKKYSEKLAYPEESFPFTGEGSRCLFCQQPVGEKASESAAEAGRRLKRFWAFIQNDAEKNAKAKREEFEKEIETILKNDFTVINIDDELFQEIYENYPEDAEYLGAYVENLNTRVREIKRFYLSENWEEIFQMLCSPLNRLQFIIDDLENQADKIEKSFNPLEQTKLLNEYQEIKGKKVLSTHKDAILKYIEQLISQHKYDNCIRATATASITRKGTEISEQAVSDTLKTALEKELSSLGLSHLKLHLEKEGGKGKTYHKLVFAKAIIGNASLSDILSEGEQRVIAIASFLAELQTSSHISGIVFDDPVSSLDHGYRENVAKRLIAEGANRQIIVFTHDIVFLLALLSESEKQRIPAYYQTLERGASGIGICYPEELPWEGKPVKRRLGFLKDLLQKMESMYKKGEKEEYDKGVRQFYDRLRQTWERSVEEILLNLVVQRFVPGIQTLRLKGVSVQDSDYSKIYHGMERCSTWVHDMAAGGKKNLPTFDDLKSDLNDLDVFIREVNERKNIIETARKDIVAPPIAEIE